MKTVNSDEIIEVPAEIAVCPKCGGKLYVNLDAWTQDYDGTWKAEDPHTECENEPDIDSDDWEEWLAWHYNMPYIDWLPVDFDVERWLKQNYRFDLGPQT
jgi:hypothetical protein